MLLGLLLLLGLTRWRCRCRRSMDVGCCSSQAVRPPRQLDLLPWDPVVPPTLPIKSPTPEPPSQAQDEATTHTTTLSMSSFRGQGRHEFEAEDEGEVDEELEEQEQEQEGQSCSTTSSNSRRRGGDDVGVGVGVGVPRKKLRLSKEQSVVLEHSFRGNTTLNPRQKQALAKQLGLLPRQVEVWFQNRRARTKLKQTEMECEHLRRCCEMLTQQNARLRRELQELRALKLCAAARRTVHAAAGTATAGTSLRMCPSCERLAAGAAAGAGRPQRAMTVQPEADKSGGGATWADLESDGGARRRHVACGDHHFT